MDTPKPSLSRRLALLVVGIIVAVGILGFFYQFSVRSRAAIDQNVRFFFPTSSVQTSVGSSLPLDLQATSEKPISIATMIIQYPRNIVTVDLNELENAISSCNSLEVPVDTSIIDGNDAWNTLVLTRGSFKADEKLPQGIFCAARIMFKGVNTGTGTIRFAPVETPFRNKEWDVAGPNNTFLPNLSGDYQEVTITVESEGTILPTVTPGITITEPPNQSTTPTLSATPLPQVSPPPPNGKQATVAIRLRYQGITEKPKTQSAISTRVRLLEGANVIDNRQVSFEPQDDGTYLGTVMYDNVSEGSSYSLLIKGAKHIQKRVCKTVPTETIPGNYRCDVGEIKLKEGNNILNFSGIMMLSGDIPLQNGIVDAVDIGYVRNNIGSKEPEALSRGDLNFDGIVDSQDYTLIIGALSFKYDE